MARSASRLRPPLAMGLLLVVSCSQDQARSWVTVSLLLDESGLFLVATRPSALGPARAPGGGPRLRFRFVTARGDELAAGEVSDPRFLRADWVEGGHLQGGEERVRFGALHLKLPAESGELSVFEGAQLLARSRLELEPSSIQTQGSRLLDPSSDVLGMDRLAGTASPERALDIAILAEGYRGEDMASFEEASAEMASRLLARPDFAKYGERVNVWRFRVRSQEVGISEPTGPAFDTAFGVKFGATSRRCTWVSREGQAAALRVGERISADVVVVLANLANNNNEIGGCAGPGFLVLVADEHAPDVLAHELGHAVFSLRDEYPGRDDWWYTEDPRVTCGPGGANVSPSAVLSNLPWASMVKAGTPLPTPDTEEHGALVGAFEGAAYCKTGWFRPARHCLMRSLDRPMCPVCACEMAQYFCRLEEAARPCTMEAECLGMVPLKAECTVTLSGAVNATFPCIPPGIGTDVNGVSPHRFTLLPTSPFPADILSMSVMAEFSGLPEAGRCYSPGDLSAAVASLMTSSGGTFMAGRGSGSIELCLTAMSCFDDRKSGHKVCPHLDGSVEAMLVDPSGGATVTMKASF